MRVISLLTFLISFVILEASDLYSQEIIHDPELSTMGEIVGDKWKTNEGAVQKKLGALEKEHGKKLNIISILVDDVGYTELGVYGSGKLRGARTPNLDKMAHQGMKLMS